MSVYYHYNMKKNLLLISLDTVRADVAYSGRFPAINSLRREGVTFLNTISSSPLTPVSHATVMTGLQPYHHGVRHLFREQYKKNIPTLAQVFKKSGYRTGAIVSCPGMNAWYGHNKGFEHYDDEIPRLSDGSDPLLTVDVKLRGSALKRAPIVIERAWRWLEKSSPKPFFLFMHFFDAHWPYEAPEKFGGNNYYEEEVAYCDHYLGLFIQKMKQSGLWDNTMVAAFSDHGEDLDGLYPNDKGGKMLGHPEECGHGCLLYDQTQKVMLVVKGQNLPARKNIKQQVRLVDLAPTIVDMAGIGHEKERFDGRSLRPLWQGKRLPDLPAYSETFYPREQVEATGGKFEWTRDLKSVRTANSHKIIYHLGSDDLEAYDLIRDANEKYNLMIPDKRKAD